MTELEPDTDRVNPFWTYEDLAFFLAAILPALLIGVLLIRAIHLGSLAVRTLLFQSLIYALLLGALFAIVSLRYGQPFWRSLSWSRPWPGAWTAIWVGPSLAFATSFLGALMRAPDVQNPIEELITSRLSLTVVMLFVIVLAPIFEELVFRGFLLPLLIRSFGPAAGILATGVLFGALHGAQNHWAWQQVTLIGFAGVVFGYAKYRTGSTAVSTILHSTFNLTGAVGFIVQMWARGRL